MTLPSWKNGYKQDKKTETRQAGGWMVPGLSFSIGCHPGPDSSPIVMLTNSSQMRPEAAAKRFCADFVPKWSKKP